MLSTALTIGCELGDKWPKESRLAESTTVPRTTGKWRIEENMREKVKPPKIGGELYHEAETPVSEAPRNGENTKFLLLNSILSQ